MARKFSLALAFCAALAACLAMPNICAAAAAETAAPLVSASSALNSASAPASSAEEQQDAQNEADKSWLLSFAEKKLSAPNRRISISGISGALSSKLSIALVSIADEQGAWLELRNITLDWNRLALLHGDISVNALSAEQVIWLRKPLPAPQPPGLAAKPGFSIPDLPVGIHIDRLSIDRLVIGAPLAGGAQAELAASGKLKLEDGLLDAELRAERAETGGAFRLSAHYGGAEGRLELQSHMEEPANGIIANLLALEGRPPLRFDAEAHGADGAYSGTAQLTAAGAPALSAQASLAPSATAGEKSVFRLRADGAFAALLPAIYRPFFGEKTALEAQGALKAGGGLRADTLRLDGDSVHLSGALETAADGFLRRLRIDGAAGGKDGAPVTLPLKGGKAQLGAARLKLDYGTGETWAGSADIEGLSLPQAQLASGHFRFGGAAENLDNAALRHISAAGGGALAGLRLQQGKSAANGDLSLKADWRAGAPLTVQELALRGAGLALTAQGEVAERQFNGAWQLAAANISDFARFLGQELSGSVNLGARGHFGLGTGVFDADMSGGLSHLRSGDARLNALLQTDIAVSGGLRRDAQGITARNLHLGNAQFQLDANGLLGAENANLDFSARLADLALLTPLINLPAALPAGGKFSGAVSARGAARGHNGLIALALTANLPQGQWAGQKVENLRLSLNSVLDNTSLPAHYSGALARGAGQIGGQELRLRAEGQSDAGRVRLDRLLLTLGQSRLEGGLTQGADGLWRGDIAVKAQDIAPLAALALMQGRGTADIALHCSAEGGAQNIDFRAVADNVFIGGLPFGKTQGQELLRLGHLQGQGSARNIFAEPQLDANLSGQNLAFRGYGIARLSLLSRAGAGFELAGQGLRSAALARAGVQPLDISAKGQMQNGALNLDARLNAPANIANGKTARAVAGRELLALRGLFWPQEQKMQLTAEVRALPLSVLPALVHNPLLAAQNPQGALSASAQIEGRFADPQIRFSAQGAQLSATVLRAAGAAPLSLRAAGSVNKHSLQLESLSLTGANALQLTAQGRVPFGAAGLDMRVKGSLPLAAVNGFAQEQGISLGGALNLDAALRGTLASPQMQGSFSLRQGQFLDAPLNLRLRPIELSGRLQGSEIIFDKALLSSPNGGAVSLGGALSLDARSGFPARLAARLNRFRYNDGATVAAELDGALSLNGALAQGAELGGNVTINKAEIRVPDNLSSAALLDISNRHITPPIAQTQKRAGLREAKTGRAAQAEREAKSRFLPVLNLRISAPNKIFVRGRGLDAEMGGALQLSGRADAPKPVGGFNLIRGRFDILAQRLVFSSGQVTLAGRLEPDLSFSAVSNGDDVSVTVNVSGTPKNLRIALSSDPALPQDEILARLIFKRSLGELSPFQVAQLVDAAAELAGVTSHSVFGSLRSGTGLDNLDIGTDSAGNAAVSAGKYIADKLYLGVETSAAGASKGTVNLDITKSLKAKGAIGSDANSNMGVFYERDY